MFFRQSHKLLFSHCSKASFCRLWVLLFFCTLCAHLTRDTIRLTCNCIKIQRRLFMCDKKHSGISVQSCSAHSTYVSKAKCIALPMQKLNRFLFGIQAKIMVNKKLTRPFSIFLSLLVSYTDEISFHARFVRFPTYNFRENWIFLINWFHFRHSFDGLKEFDGYINRHKTKSL